jgi:two-component system NtrC family sensor kinase
MTAADTDAILIVDDSLTVRMDLADAFQTSGLRPLPCANLAEARAALAAGPIAVAILDVLLPDGDGLDLLQEIRAAAATVDLPVLMLSTEAEVRDRIRGMQIGATDYVGKPYDRSQVVSRARALARRPVDRRAAVRATILVIDDSLTFREELGRVLKSAGYDVIAAETGEQGLQLAADHRPDAIVVDGMMPGIDGGTVVRRVRLDLALRGTPCLMLTASATGQAELQALDAGADTFVSKSEDLGVILARLAALLRHSASGRADAASLLAPKRILAVDDSLTYLNTLSDVLREEGYDVIQAHSGEEALDMLAAQPADCILLDVVMPGLGGREACRRIKASPGVREIPLIMLTALEEREAMIDGLTLGADDYISKSSDFAVLKARVRAQLRRKQVEDEHRRVREKLLRNELAAAESLAARTLAEARAAMSDELTRKNKELEAFSYSVSHDLRAPLRVVDGFSRALLEGYGAGLDDQGRKYLQRIRSGAQRMGELIDDLLELARLSATALNRETVNLAEIARSVIAELQRREPERQMIFEAEEEILAKADQRLMRVVFENLLGNAWKFTARADAPRIEFHSQPAKADGGGGVVFLVKDNGAGFDMAYASKLFAPFQRLHNEVDYPGTGIGLATVHRILDRHGGRVWAEGVVGQGATVFFTLAESPAIGGLA